MVLNYLLVVCPWNFHLLILFTSFLCHQNHSSTVLNAKNLQTSIISDTTRNAHLFGNIRVFIQRLRRRLRKRHKVNLRCLKLDRTYSISLNSSNVGKVFWSWILKDDIKVQEKKRKLLSFVPVLDKTWNVVVVQQRQRNVQKSVMHVQSCCFASLNLLLLCRSRYHRRRGYFSKHREQYFRGTQLSAKYLFHKVFTAAWKFQ